MDSNVEASIGNNDDYGEEEESEPEPAETLTTKVYYFVNDRPIPFPLEVPVPPSEITLHDFKARFVNHQSYKYYHKIEDPFRNCEFKAEIHDSVVLKPNRSGRFELFLIYVDERKKKKKEKKSNRNDDDGYSSWTYKLLFCCIICCFVCSCCCCCNCCGNCCSKCFRHKKYCEHKHV